MASIGLSGSAAASAAMPYRAPISPRGLDNQYSTDQAGWRTTPGPLVPIRFRFAEAVVTIPSCSPVHSGAGVGLAGYTANNFALGAGIRCGGGKDTVFWDYDGGLPGSDKFGYFDMRPSIGDRMLLSVYHDTTAHQDRITITNLRSHRTRFMEVDGRGADVFYRHAMFTVMRDSAIGDQNVRSLWTFTNCRVTTEPSADHPAVRGTLFGPWSTIHLTATSDGTSTGRVTMYAHWPSDAPVNDAFSVEVNPPASHMP